MKLKNTKKYRLEMALGIFIILGLALTPFANSVTQVITSDSNNNVTFITNSNGGLWEATGSNIQLAINDCDNVTGSKVTLAPGVTYTTSSSIDTWYNMTLDLNGGTIAPNGDFNVTNVYISSKLMNGRIDTSGVGGYSSNAVVIVPALGSGGGEPTWRFSYASCEVSTGIYNLDLISTGQNGVGVNMSISGGNSHIYFVDASNVYTKQFNIGFYLGCTTGGGLNGNKFSDLYSWDEKYGIFINDGGTSEISGNSFVDCQFQPYDSTNIYAIYINGGNGNIFSNVVVWDWGSKGDSSYCINIASGNGNVIYSSQGVTTSTVNDGGIDTAIFDDDMLFNKYVFVDVASGCGVIKGTSEGAGFKIESDGGDILLAYGSDISVSCFEGCDYSEHNQLKVYGRMASGNREDISLAWGTSSADGYIDTSSGGGNIIMTPDGGYVNITGTLNVSTKIECAGGVDPPYVLFDRENKLSIIERLNREVDKDKEYRYGGQALYYDADLDNMFIMNPKTGDTREFVWKSDFDLLEQRIEKLEEMMQLLIG